MCGLGEKEIKVVNGKPVEASPFDGGPEGGPILAHRDKPPVINRLIPPGWTEERWDAACRREDMDN